ncbi:MAG: hypothetical protein HN849_28070 [Victivallales bacterium]|nr:hypothetical protein [Victivallales bacterium]
MIGNHPNVLQFRLWRVLGLVLPFTVMAQPQPAPAVAAARGAVSNAALAEMRTQRRKAAERPRRVWFNHDGCDASSFRKATLKGRKATPQDLLDVRTTPLAKTQVDTLSYCTISSGFSNFTHRTSAGHLLAVPSAQEGRVNITQDLVDQGTDPLEVMVKFCHQNDMECFWSMRMNDTHDAGWRPGTGHRLFPKLKEDHPEYLVGSYKNKPRYGTWTSVNYARPEIRDLCFRYIEEVCQNYDVDGIEMDFFRHLCFFKSVAEGGRASQAELDMMTGLIRRIRQMTEREAVRRGRPILVAIRVPDSVEYAKGLGLDFERWMAEGLVDCLIGSGYFRLNHWTDLVQLGHKHGVKVYPCLSETRVGGWAGSQRDRRRASDDCYRARAAVCWQAGADGIYIFNEYRATRRYLHDIGDVATLQRKPKHYFVTVRNGSPGRYLADGNRYIRRDILGPQNPRKITDGEALKTHIEVAEDFSWVAGTKRKPEILCTVAIDGLEDSERPSVRLNGHPLAGATKVGEALAYPVDPACLKQGINTVAVTCGTDLGHQGDGAPRDGEPWDVIYTGEAVMKMPGQLPWRRLFRNSSWLEEARDGALFLADRGTGPEDWCNLAYPWNVSAPRTVVAEAQVKVLSSTAPLGICMRVANGRSVEYLAIEPTGVTLMFAGLSFPMDTTGAFHTYRLTARQKDIRLYVDGTLALDGRGKFTTSSLDKRHWLPFTYGKADWSACSFAFGSASGPGTGEAVWRQLKLRGKARSLTDLHLRVSYPEQAVDVPKWDVEFAGDSVPTKPWSADRPMQATHAETQNGYLLVADRGTEQGDYLHFRYPWNVTPESGATAEARVKVLSGWSGFRCDDGVHTGRLRILSDGLFLEGVRGGGRYAMNTTDSFHTYRMVTQGEDIKVYVDGKLRIDGSGCYTRPAVGGRNDVGFGAANSPSLGEALWDYVRFARKAY